MMELPNILVESVIQRGTILYSDIFENIDHPKFFVVIGITDDSVAGFFYINSKINENIIRKVEQYELQYKITPSDYKFLEHDSYICATEISVLSRTVLSDSIQNKHTAIKGELKLSHLNELLQKLRESRLFSPIEKRKYFY